MKYSSVYQFLWSVIKPYRWYYLIMLMPAILTSFYEFANNYSLKLVIDAFSTGNELRMIDLAFPITIFISAQILLDIIWRIGDIAEWRSEPYVRQALISKSYDYVQHNPYPFFQDTQPGAITSRIKGILDGYDDFWASMHHDFTPKVANIIISTILLSVASVKVCLFVAAWTLLLFAIMVPLTKKIDQLSFHNANVRHRIFGLIADNIINIFTIFSFATRNLERKKLNQLITHDFIPANLKVYYYNFKFHLVGGFLYWIILIALFLYTIHLRQINEVTTGDLAFIMGLSYKMLSDLWQTIHKLQDFMRNIGDLKSSFELLRTPHEEKAPMESKEIEIQKPSIEFENLYFSYSRDKPLFTNLSIHIKPGEKVGLVGISGAGKSTLISLLLKNFKPKSGRILIDEQDIALYSEDAIRKKISYIPQDIMLFHRTILDNIRYGNEEATSLEIAKAAQKANIHDYILSLPDQYNTEVGERGVKLSGGQRQRIAIARAFLKDAPILILDEATSSLDTETEQMIQESLNLMLDDRKITVIAIAHRLSTLKHMDRIIVLDSGSIIEEGTHKQLISRDSFYKKLWELQKI